MPEKQLDTPFSIYGATWLVVTTSLILNLGKATERIENAWALLPLLCVSDWLVGMLKAPGATVDITSRGRGRSRSTLMWGASMNTRTQTKDSKTAFITPARSIHSPCQAND